MKNLAKYRITALALIISFSIISGSEFWHHHNDANYDESQCPVCLIIHSFTGVDTAANTDFIKPVIFEFFSPAQAITNTQPGSTSVLSDRAPPHIS